MGVEQIRTEAEATQLAADLNGPHRAKPYVVVSTPASRTEPFIDPETIFDAVGDLAAVFVLPTGAHSWAFSRAMPPLTQVYGGAGRVYPVGSRWVVDPKTSPLRFAFNADEGRATADHLIADALNMASDAGLLAKPNSKPLFIEGEIKSVVPPSRAIVRTSDGGLAAIWQELLFSDVDVERTFRPGMAVRGYLDPGSRRYDPSPDILHAKEALADYCVGEVVLVRVADVGEQHATLQLYPHVVVTIDREDVTSNDLDSLSSLMSPGEVISARVLATAPHWRLSLLDVDDDEKPRQAPSLLRGGPPWLLPPAPETAVEQTAAEPSPLETALEIGLPPPPPAPQLDAILTDSRPVDQSPSPLLLDRKRGLSPARLEMELAELRRYKDQAERARERAEQQVVALQDRLLAMQAEHQLIYTELENAKRDRDRSSEELRRSRTALRKARLKAARAASFEDADAGPQFADPEEQMRHEVYLSWVRRIPAAEKDHRRLPGYTFGPAFLASVDSLDGISRSKIADVVVEIVTGLVNDLPGRELHQLRANQNADAPPVRRDDGATCWRAALQVNTPQARRIHFWRLPDGTLELSRVVLHDDFTP